MIRPPFPPAVTALLPCIQAVREPEHPIDGRHPPPYFQKDLVNSSVSTSPFGKAQGISRLLSPEGPDPAPSCCRSSPLQRQVTSTSRRFVWLTGFHRADGLPTRPCLSFQTDRGIGLTHMPELRLFPPPSVEDPHGAPPAPLSPPYHHTGPDGAAKYSGAYHSLSQNRLIVSPEIAHSGIPSLIRPGHNREWVDSS